MKKVTCTQLNHILFFACISKGVFLFNCRQHRSCWVTCGFSMPPFVIFLLWIWSMDYSKYASMCLFVELRVCTLYTSHRQNVICRASWQNYHKDCRNNAFFMQFFLQMLNVNSNRWTICWQAFYWINWEVNWVPK